MSASSTAQRAAVRRYYAQVDHFRARSGDWLARVLQASAYVVSEGITVGNGNGPGTPVAWGFAVNSWWVVVGPSAAPGGTHPNPPPEGVRMDPRAAFDAIAVGVLGARVGDVIVWNNGAAYIRKLEYEGHSPQARGGWVRIHASQWLRIVATVAAALDQGGGA